MNSCGARIYGAGESTVEIEGVEELYPCIHRVIPDRIVAATYMCAGAMQADELVIKDIRASHLTPIIPVFGEAGCKIYLSGGSLKLVSPKRLKAVKQIKTMPYPGFPTDCQSVVMSAMSTAKGTSVFNESVFDGRYKHISELKRFGADITAEGRTAVVTALKSCMAQMYILRICEAVPHLLLLLLQQTASLA